MVAEMEFKTILACINNIYFSIVKDFNSTMASDKQCNVKYLIYFQFNNKFSVKYKL